MSELEPDDSRTVTQSTDRAPGEPPRTGPREGESRGQQSQSQSQNQSQGQSPSNWRADEAATADRAAQDHELAGGIDAPSLRPEADDGQWSQQPEDTSEESARRLTPEEDYPLGVDRPGAERLGTEPRGAREPMAASERSDDAARRDQAERGGS